MGQCYSHYNILYGELRVDDNKFKNEEIKQTNIESNRKINININDINKEKKEEDNIKSFTPNTQEITPINLQEQQLLINNQESKVKNSVYTNFRKGNPLLNKNNRQSLLESLQSKNSDILFESFSISNIDKGNNSLLIDYYQIGKNIFDILNEIRCDPFEKGKEYNLNLSNFNPGDVISWSEKVYLCCSSYLMEIEKGKKMPESNSREKVNEKLKGNYNLVEFFVEGLGTPNLIINKLFNENKEWWSKLISDNYLSGAVCCYPFKNGKTMKTLIYLIKE
jgi:hypothetical protein